MYLALIFGGLSLACELALCVYTEQLASRRSRDDGFTTSRGVRCEYWRRRAAARKPR